MNFNFNYFTYSLADHRRYHNRKSKRKEKCIKIIDVENTKCGNKKKNANVGVEKSVANRIADGKCPG